MSHVEQELADILGLEGKDRERACGRANGPVFVVKPALGQPGTSGAKTSEVTRAWRQLSIWLRAVQQGL
eukprot:5432967-Karenia_brevis.AAC.1